MEEENTLISIFAWVVGILVSLAVGAGMIQNILTVPGIPNLIIQIAGWVVVVGAIISVVLAVFKR
jgi:hypothetical protein